jgi:hypothetical protein
MLHGAKPRIHHIQILADLSFPNIRKGNMIKVFLSLEVILVAVKRGIDVN